MDIPKEEMEAMEQSHIMQEAPLPQLPLMFSQGRETKAGLGLAKPGSFSLNSYCYFFSHLGSDLNSNLSFLMPLSYTHLSLEKTSAYTWSIFSTANRPWDRYGKIQQKRTS